MDYIKGMTFAAFAGKGCLARKEAYNSIDLLIERTGVNFIILVPNGIQETPQSETIDYHTKATMADDELINMVNYIHDKGVRVAIKPTANCKNGTWRAHISFFDKDVPCEPKWCNWFASYTEFQLHYARIAEQTGCEMFIAGCEMVMSEHREAEWRKLIADIRTVYSGTVSYNTDKYQEDNITWWDCVDVISSSGYYPIDDWDSQLDRIEKVVKKFNKPFFFAEAGCMSTEGSAKVPNDWRIEGAINLQQQADWYSTTFETAGKRDFVQGFCFWSWAWKQYSLKAALKDGGYDIYGKPAEEVVRKFGESKG
ncbi:MAG: 1,4-beta-xylanase [Lachnospiraceae bacterium]|nr:1,4-beta-xylanase [Lachnospiraceae bacterium]